MSDLVDHHLLLHSDLYVLIGESLALVEQLADNIRLPLAGY